MDDSIYTLLALLSIDDIKSKENNEPTFFERIDQMKNEIVGRETVCVREGLFNEKFITRPVTKLDIIMRNMINENMVLSNDKYEEIKIPNYKVVVPIKFYLEYIVNTIGYSGNFSKSYKDKEIFFDGETKKVYYDNWGAELALSDDSEEIYVEKDGKKL